MCGIVGIYSKKSQINKSEFIKLRDLMVHRGPDDAGIYMNHENNFALGHRRLSILDLSEHGHQPMVSKNNNVLCFNGEIYNYIELANSELNYNLKDNHSDTNVLLRLLEKDGVNCINRLNGMWGFIYFDTNKNELIISRDRFGKKPVYYYENDEVLMVASELKPIIESEYYRKKINQKSVDEYIKTGLVDGLEDTFFEGIKRFPSASYGIYSLNENKFKVIEKFYTIEESIYKVSDNEEENIEKFKELFIDAVKIRMRSDVEVGTCLSGGLDSSSIYCVASEISKTPLQSFSSRFKEEGYDEGYFIDKVVEKYPGKNHFTFPEYKNFEEKLRKIIYYLEEPSKAMGVYPQWHVMELASKHLKVLLDGQGGDEVLAGYDSYYGPYLADVMTKNPLSFLSAVLDIKDKKDLKLLSTMPRATARVLLKDNKKFNNSFLSERLIRDVYKNMLPALVKYEDKIGMAFSIEARMPFLDYRLVNFAFSLDEKYKIKKGWNKSILRDSMKDFLPVEITYRKDKKGFPTPFNKILEKNKHLEKYIPNNIKDEWTKWRYVSLGIWKEIFFKEENNGK